MSLTIDQTFDLELTDPNTAKFKELKSIFEKIIEDSYKDVTGYKKNSATVTRFRSGSVIADFTIETASDQIDLAPANNKLITNLNNNGYKVNSIARSVENGLYSGGTIYPETYMIMNCQPEQGFNQIVWTKDGTVIGKNDVIDDAQHTLTLKSAKPTDSGTYACSTTVNSVPYIIWQKITVQPYPNIQKYDYVVPCDSRTVTVQCCAESSYTLEWKESADCPETGTGCISCKYAINTNNCPTTNNPVEFKCQLSLKQLSNFSYSSKTVQITTSTDKNPDCNDSTFGPGNVNDVRYAPCPEGMAGNKIGTCKTRGGPWSVVDNCVLRIIQDLKLQAEHLDPFEIPQFVANLSTVAASNAPNITNSTATVLTIVDLLKTIASLSQTVALNQTTMEEFLKTLETIGSNDTTWDTLNSNDATKNASSELLKSVESIGGRLLNRSLEINTPSIQLKKNNFSNSFNGTFGQNLTTQIEIPGVAKNEFTFITIIVFEALDNILPVRNATSNGSSIAGVVVNGNVAAVILNNTVQNISLNFDLNQTSLGNPQCVFWNFSLLDGIGGWDSTGCKVQPIVNQTGKFKCECDHATPFSILMSPFFLDNPALAYITYIGVGISMGSLILCLIIEGIIWKTMTRNDTSYMRHVSIVNIALSLLIANICFIIGAAIVKEGGKTPVGPCSTATFFIHFFYLALFFWMLLSALLLLYRTVMVFSGMSKCKMMAIAFTVGYGAPLLIAVITVAVTAGGGGYIQEENACWLNWFKTKALLAFVIPALTIVAVNLLVLVVVLYKMLRRGVGAATQPDEKHALVVIARCVAILTPFFGLTWGFGIGTMVSSALGVHIVFAILNSLQGFFILVFGTLLDSKIREALAGKLSLVTRSSNRTRSTSAGPSSSSGLAFLQRFRRRNGYNISDNSGFTASASDTFIST
ncbi:adhesion G protein-coupled receptor F4-like [Pygocentrus nattereri]|uniref:adhesion G protein-coupled receptor F4-like n=1 Tax=Pygocentrus nattereri TaxID=42514 RepID=UPI0008143BA9|nr:adhesion G protein-coupled receptor F4-like [Pygocentrus nattereri]